MQGPMDMNSTKRRYFYNVWGDYFGSAIRELLSYHNPDDSAEFYHQLDWREVIELRQKRYQAITKITSRLVGEIRDRLYYGKIDTVSFVNIDGTILECGLGNAGNIYVQLKKPQPQE